MKPDPMLPQKRQRIESPKVKTASKKNSGKNSKKKSAIKKKAKGDTEMLDDEEVVEYQEQEENYWVP